jgi:hypothetical protein
METGHDACQLVAGVVRRRRAEHAGQVLRHELRRGQRGISQTSSEAALGDWLGERPLLARVRIGENKGPHTVGVASIELLREEPSPGEPDDVGLANPSGMKKPGKGIRPVDDPKRFRGIGRLARTGGVRRDHRELVRES